METNQLKTEHKNKNERTMSMNNRTDDVVISKHAVERANERLGINDRKELETKAKKALERGKRANDFKSAEKNCLKKKESENIDAVVHDNICFIFNDNCLVTLYDFTQRANRKAYFKGKEQIRDTKKYLRYEDYCDEYSNFKHYKIS